ncbi:hypothetical protein FRC03_009036 [Tulasnella sp. 419]|nr:hypothetical protein FRC03_009036 [Tulasnella sp. 419]
MARLGHSELLTPLLHSVELVDVLLPGTPSNCAVCFKSRSLRRLIIREVNYNWEHLSLNLEGLTHLTFSWTPQVHSYLMMAVELLSLLKRMPLLQYLDLRVGVLERDNHSYLPGEWETPLQMSELRTLKLCMLKGCCSYVWSWLKCISFSQLISLDISHDVQHYECGGPTRCGTELGSTISIPSLKAIVWRPEIAECPNFLLRAFIIAPSVTHLSIHFSWLSGYDVLCALDNMPWQDLHCSNLEEVRLVMEVARHEERHDWKGYMQGVGRALISKLPGRKLLMSIMHGEATLSKVEYDGGGTQLKL